MNLRKIVSFAAVVISTICLPLIGRAKAETPLAAPPTMSGEVYIMKASNGTVSYEDIIMTAVARGDNPLKMIEAINRFHSNLTLHHDDPSEIAGASVDKFKLAESSITLAVDSIAGLGGYIAAGHKGATMAVAATESILKVIKDGVDIGSQYYDFAQPSKHEVPTLQDATLKLQNSIEACEAHFPGCRQVVYESLDKRYNLKISQGELPAAVVAQKLQARINDHVGSIEASTAQGLKTFKTMLNQLKANAAKDAKNETALNSLAKQQLERERTDFDNQMEHRELQNYLNLGQLFVPREAQTQARYRIVQNLILDIHTATIFKESALNSAKIIALKSGEQLSESTISKIVTSYELNTALLVYSAYNAWIAEQGTQNEFSAISAQLAAIDAKLTEFIKVAITNFEEIKVKLDNIDERAKSLMKTENQLNFRTSRSGESADLTEKMRTQAHNTFVFNPTTPMDLSRAARQEYVNKYLEMAKTAHVEMERPDIFSSVNKTEVAHTLDLLLPDSPYITSKQWVFDEAELLTDLSKQIFSYYQEQLTNEEGSKSANALLRYNVKNLAKFGSLHPVPNLGVWYDVTQFLIKNSNQDPKTFGEESILRARQIGQTIQDFYQSTTNSAYFHSAIRYSLAHAINDVVMARNDLWRYSLNSFGADGDPKDQIKFVGSDTMDGPNEPDYKSCGDSRVKLFRVDNELSLRIKQNPKNFEKLKVLQMMRILNERQLNQPDGFFACTDAVKFGTEVSEFSVRIGYTDARTNAIMKNPSGVEAFRFYFNTNMVPPIKYFKLNEQDSKDFAKLPHLAGIQYDQNPYVWLIKLSTLLYERNFAKASTIQDLVATSSALDSRFNSLRDYAYNTFSMILAAGLPSFEEGIYFADARDGATKKLKSVVAVAKAKAFYDAVDRYLLVYYTYVGFARMQNYVPGGLNYRCASALQFDGFGINNSETPVEPNLLFRILVQPKEIIDSKPILDSFLKASYDPNRTVAPFVCQDPGPLALPAAIHALDSIQKRAHSWW